MGRSTKPQKGKGRKSAGGKTGNKSSALGLNKQRVAPVKSAGGVDQKKKNSARSTGTPKEFDRQFVALHERSNGSKNPNKKRDKRQLSIAEPIFQLPSRRADVPAPSPACADDQAHAGFTADQLLAGEKTEPIKVQRAKSVSAPLTCSNRFGHLENDELLEDGTFSYLRMDVRAPTFSLDQQK
mmetsp:Transcript_9871/g.22157  ORF Transcript_9871/g.22157 Transcript_9871/m.22157 type:complete len:183 (-) Transcript_9871:79-627(-)